MADQNTPEQTPKKRWRRWVLEIALLVAVYVAVSAWRDRGGLASDGKATAPAFALTSLDGNVVRLDDLAGKTVLLHFWATWCGVCRAEISMLNAIQERLDPGQILLTVAMDDEGKLRDFVAERQIRYPVLFGTRDVLTAYRVSAFPTNYVINPLGRIESHTVGLSTRFGLETRLGCAAD